MPEQVGLGAILRNQRKKLNKTLQQTASEAQLSYGYLSKLEQGDSRRPSLTRVAKLAGVLKLDEKELLRIARKEARTSGASGKTVTSPVHLELEVRMATTVPILVTTPGAQTDEACRRAARGLAENLEALGKALCLSGNYDEGLRSFRTAEYVFQTYGFQRPLLLLKFRIARTMQNAVLNDLVPQPRAASHLRLSVDYLDLIVQDLETSGPHRYIDDQMAMEEIYLLPLALFVGGAVHMLMAKHTETSAYVDGSVAPYMSLVTSIARPRFEKADLITSQYLELWEKPNVSPMPGQIPRLERICAYGNWLRGIIGREYAQIEPDKKLQNFTDAIPHYLKAIGVQRDALLARRDIDTSSVHAEGMGFLARCHKDLAVTFQYCSETVGTTYNDKLLSRHEALALSLWHIELASLLDPHPAMRYVVADDSAISLRETYAEDMEDEHPALYSAIQKEVAAIDITKLNYSLQLPEALSAVVTRAPDEDVAV